MKCCKDCTKRYVGCHSKCQTYVANKVINTYKRNKANVEKDLTFNNNYYETMTQGNMKRHDNFKMKVFKG